MRRFEQAARAASALDHPNIVTIHDIGEAEAGRFIVMKAVERRRLRTLVGEPRPVTSLAKSGRKIAKVLAADGSLYSAQLAERATGRCRDRLRIGCGGNGISHEVWQVSLNRKDALKVTRQPRARIQGTRVFLCEAEEAR